MHSCSCLVTKEVTTMTHSGRLLALAQVVTLVVPAALFSQDHPPGAHGGMHGQDHAMHACPMMTTMPAMVLMHGDALGLTPQQRERVTELHGEAQRSMMPAMHRLQELHRDLEGIAQAERFDAEAARTAARQVGELHAQMLETMLPAAHHVHQMLTVEQRQELERLRDHSRPMDAGMGMMMHCPMMHGGDMPHHGTPLHPHR